MWLVTTSLASDFNLMGDLHRRSYPKSPRLGILRTRKAHEGAVPAFAIVDSIVFKVAMNQVEKAVVYARHRKMTLPSLRAPFALVSALTLGLACGGGEDAEPGQRDLRRRVCRERIRVWLDELGWQLVTGSGGSVVLSGVGALGRDRLDRSHRTPASRLAPAPPTSRRRCRARSTSTSSSIARRAWVRTALRPR